MMIQRPRVLLVGVGYGHYYLEEMLQHDTGADLIGIVDSNPAVVEKWPIIAEKNVPMYASLEEFFAHDRADLALITTPIHLHGPMTQYCFDHGCHVLCEKPLCLTLEEARQMQAAAQASGKILALGYQQNYRRDILALKKDILSGRFGKAKRMRLYHAFRRGAVYYARNNWAGRISVNGHEVLDSPFANASAHNFQVMTFLLGSGMDTSCGIRKLEGEVFHGNPAVENYDIAMLRCLTDTDTEILYYTAHPLRTKRFGPCGVFEFEKATITLPGENIPYHVETVDGEVFDYDQVTPHDSMQKLYDVIDCLRFGGKPACSAMADQAHIQAVLMAQQLPVRTVREELRRYEDMEDDRFVIINGLEDLIIRCAENWALPGEMGVRLD